MESNHTFIQNLKIEDVPWHRLTTAYGRATDFPEYFQIIQEMSEIDRVSEAMTEIVSCIEHQGTLWHSTPLAMAIFARIFENAVSKMDTNECARFIARNLLELFQIIAVCFQDAQEMGFADDDPLPNFSDLLKEEYLWSEEYDPDEDEARYEDEPFPEELFCSFWFYSYEVLQYLKPILEKLEGTALDAENVLTLL